MYKFLILDIETNKIKILIVLKYRPSFHDFNKLVIKFKNICKNKKKLFWDFFNMLKYANIIYFLETWSYTI
jgi:hypothetical protein